MPHPPGLEQRFLSQDWALSNFRGHHILEAEGKPPNCFPPLSNIRNADESADRGPLILCSAKEILVNPYEIDARQFVQDHEVFLTLLDRMDCTPEELESLESLENLLGELRGKLLDGADWDYIAKNLEEARALDGARQAVVDNETNLWQQLEPFGKVFVSALLARLVVGGLSWIFKPKRPQPSQ